MLHYISQVVYPYIWTSCCICVSCHVSTEYLKICESSQISLLLLVCGTETQTDVNLIKHETKQLVILDNKRVLHALLMSRCNFEDSSLLCASTVPTRPNEREQMSSSIAAAFGTLVTEYNPKTQQKWTGCFRNSHNPSTRILKCPFLFSPSRLIYLCKLT